MKCFKSNGVCFAVIAAFTLIVSFSSLANAQGKVKLDPEDVVAKHLLAFGSADSIAAANQRSMKGKSNFKSILNSIVNVNGTANWTSSLSDLGMFLVFNTQPSDEYRQEKIDFDGRKVTVAFATATRRSPLGQFLFENPEIVKKGLFGGTLNADWALLGDRKSKIKKLNFHGYEKIDGTELIVLRCSIDGSNLSIKLYFHPENYAHVRTSYSYEIQPPVTISDEGRVSAIKHVFVESFTGQMPVSGLVIPSVYKINYMFDSSSRSGQYEWTMNFSRFEFKKDTSTQ